MRASQPWQLLVVLAVMTLQTSLAQAPTGTIAGVVTDQTGAVISHARITIANKGTGATRSLVSGADGSFNAPSLAAGDYQVKVAVEGFSTLIRDAIVETGGTTTVNLK